MKREDGENLNLRDLQVFHHTMVENQSNVATAKLMGVSHDTIGRTKKKAAYHQLITDAMEAEGEGPVQFARRLIKGLDAKKSINVAGKVKVVTDNMTRTTNLEIWADVAGAKAPKELNLTHGIKAETDDELLAELEDSMKRHGIEAVTIENEYRGKKRPKIINDSRKLQTGPVESVSAILQNKAGAGECKQSTPIAELDVGNGEQEEIPGNPA